MAAGLPDDAAETPLDAYSRVVSSVAAAVTPHVAAVRVRAGGGSAVVVAADGLMLTNAHVLGRSSGGTAAFADGTESPFDVVGVDPLSDLAVVRVRGTAPPPAVLGDADRLVVASSSSRWAARSAWPGRSPRGWSARSVGRCRCAADAPDG